MSIIIILHYTILWCLVCTEDVYYWSNTNVARTPYALFRSPFTCTIYLRYPILSSIGNLSNSLIFFILLLSFISVSVVFYCPERHVKTISSNPCTIIIWFIQWSIRIPNNSIRIPMRTYHNIIHTYKLFEI